MEFNLSTLETLIKSKKVEIQEGVFLVCDQQEIKTYMYLKDGNIRIDFDAPFVCLHIEKLGFKKLINLVNPRIEYIVIKEKSFDVKLSSLGNWEFPRGE